MEEKALKKLALKKEHGENEENEGNEVQVQEHDDVLKDEAASSVYSVKEEENSEGIEKQVEIADGISVEIEKRPEMGGSLIDWVNEATAEEEKQVSEQTQEALKNEVRDDTIQSEQTPEKQSDQQPEIVEYIVDESKLEAEIIEAANE